MNNEKAHSYQEPNNVAQSIKPELSHDYCYLLINNQALKIKAEPEIIIVKNVENIPEQKLNNVENFNNRLVEFNALKSKHEFNIKNGIYDKLYAEKGSFNGLHPKEVIEKFIQSEKKELFSKEVQLKASMSSNHYEDSNTFEKVFLDKFHLNKQESIQINAPESIENKTLEQNSKQINIAESEKREIKLHDKVFVLDENQMRDLIKYNQNGGSIVEYLKIKNIEHFNFEDIKKTELSVKTELKSILDIKALTNNKQEYNKQEYNKQEKQVDVQPNNKNDNLPSQQALNDEKPHTDLEHRTFDVVPVIHEQTEEFIQHRSLDQWREEHESIEGHYGLENYFYDWPEIEKYTSKHEKSSSLQNQYTVDGIKQNTNSNSKDKNQNKNDVSKTIPKESKTNVNNLIKNETKSSEITANKNKRKEGSKIFSEQAVEKEAEKINCYLNSIVNGQASREVFRDNLKNEQLLASFEKMPYSQRRKIRLAAVEMAMKEEIIKDKEPGKEGIKLTSMSLEKTGSNSMMSMNFKKESQ